MGSIRNAYGQHCRFSEPVEVLPCDDAHDGGSKCRRFEQAAQHAGWSGAAHEVVIGHALDGILVAGVFEAHVA